MSTHMSWRKSSHSGSQANCVEVSWHKSTFSSTQGDCIEIGWRRSSRSGTQANCVEAAPIDATIGVRDSKDPSGPVLTFTAAHFSTALTAIKAGHLDR